jgi:hypothetical protein
MGKVVASLAVSLMMVCACGSVEPSLRIESTATATSAPDGVSQSPSPLIAPTTSPPAPLSLNDLDVGNTELALTAATAICEPEPAQANPDIGSSTIGCTDGLTWALAAVRTLSDDDVTRMFLDRPDCPALGCSEADLNEADVYVWLGDQSYTVGLDMTNQSAALAAATTDAPWPTSSGSAVPPVTRANVKAAPEVLAQRDAMPFCGRTVRGDPQSIPGCFRDAVIEGRPAEMVDVTYTAHGERVVRLFRYTGGRPVEVFRRYGRVWRHSFGAMSLRASPSMWDFIPWGSGVRMDLPG